MAASIISVIFPSSTSENLEHEVRVRVRVRVRTLHSFHALLSITHSVTLMSLGNGDSRDQF